MYRLTEDDIKIMRVVEEITGMDYEIDEIHIPEECLINAIRDLLDEIERLNDALADMADDMEENYELKPTYDWDDDKWRY